MTTQQSRSISVRNLEKLDIDEVDAWISCHGYESRSIAHIGTIAARAANKFSFGFDFPDTTVDLEVGERLRLARLRLESAGFSVSPTDDAGFQSAVREMFHRFRLKDRYHVVADISSMSRARIASLLVACASLGPACDLDVIYFPGTYSSHKHDYEPLESLGPCHGAVAGWPEDPDLPLALLIGLGTEPRRADGVVESLGPDILALFVPLGDEELYLQEIRAQNRRVLEVGGEPTIYPLRDPRRAYESLLATAARLVERTRLVVIPMGPKIFFAVSVAAALSLGPQVGVWKASAGRGIQPVDVLAASAPVLFRIVFRNT